MEMEDPESSTSPRILEELDVGALLLTLEKGLKAPRWRERVQAADSTASTLVKDGCLRHVSPKDDPSVGASHDVDVYDKLLRQLLHGLALKDSNWQVRVAAVESATTIVAAARTVLPVERFAEYVLVVLAVCLDVQPEVQETAANCTLQRLLIPSSLESHGVVVQLCDRFVEAAIGADSFPLKKSAKISGNSEIAGLDNLPDGEILLAGMIAAICLQLLPSPAAAAAADGARGRQDKVELDRLPLLLVAVAGALVDSNKRQSRMIAGGLSRLLRSLGKPFYRPALVAMFNAKSRVYLSGPGLAGTYQHAGIINEDTANVVKSIATVTILEALAFAFEGPHASESWADAFISNTGSEDESSSKSGLSKGELIALQQIVEMLQVPEDLTRTLKGQEMEAKAFEFTKSAVPLVSISTLIVKSGNGVAQDPFLPGKMVQDILLCCAAFAGGGEEYGGTAMWTSKEVGELSIKWLKSLPDVDLSHPAEATPVSNPGGLKDSADTSIEKLILGQISSLLPRIKQIIQESSGSPGADEILLKLSPEGTLGSSIVAAHQMQWILSQLQHPNLGPHCQLVMPCVLTALDHFSTEVKRPAMKSCIQLAQNMNATELRWYKDVTLDAVARSLIGSEDLWPVAVKMAVTTVSRIEGRNPRSAWCGRIFSEMLEELARHRDDQNRRVVWLQEIPPQMELMGLVLVAHFKRLLPLLFYWLHAPDDLTRILTLNRLQTVITYTWPRIPVHVKRIWKEIMHTYQESRNRKASSDIQTAVCGVCRLLHSCAGPTFEAVWQQDEEDEAIGDLIAAIKQMKTETIV